MICIVSAEFALKAVLELRPFGEATVIESHTVAYHRNKQEQSVQTLKRGCKVN